MSVDAGQFKNALRLWASGVTVVTAYSSETGPRGMTATSFSSVSIDPPQILVCLNQNTDTGALVLAQQQFAVNVLTTDQQAVSNQFAGGSSQAQRFAEVAWQLGENATPLLSEALVSLECKVVQQVLAGTHWVVIGEVQNVVCRTGDPVLYYDGSYRQLS
ncbi:flavin reductase family protein [Methylomonas paludis]|uniref:Flavin reductase family protein n=1 Tax=Methylomonas paludis TaxID=1173101 RepID=A0A975MMA7_9GAMM|nr:flavin reductase family protein [Methylomonas paludis]QWF69984.1 flavin reductase family protein [Methylomonas paludis]